MPPDPPSPVSLDALAERAAGGDAAAAESLFGVLRVRFLAVAKRRLQDDETEDVVQDALDIVHRRYRTRPASVPILPWGLVVLRNVIGNRYQRHDRREPAEELRPGATAAADPIEEAEGADLIAQAIRQLTTSHPRCGEIFRHLLESFDEGGGPHEISTRAMAQVREDHPEMTRTGFYVMLHRCRAKLRTILAALRGEDE